MILYEKHRVVLSVKGRIRIRKYSLPRRSRKLYCRSERTSIQNAGFMERMFLLNGMITVIIEVSSWY
jgi:hypothetical protein